MIVTMSASEDVRESMLFGMFRRGRQLRVEPTVHDFLFANTVPNKSGITVFPFLSPICFVVCGTLVEREEERLYRREVLASDAASHGILISADEISECVSNVQRYLEQQ